MKIVNIKKFIRSMVLILGILVLITFIFISNSFSHSEINYRKIYVSNGDTLWTIAKSEKNNNIYFENKDIEEIIYELKSINNLKNSNLIIGQELSIPNL